MTGQPAPRLARAAGSPGRTADDFQSGAGGRAGARHPGSGGELIVETDVLIVGGGPAGLCASALLSRHGVASLLSERHRGVSVFPRSNVVSARTMEIFRVCGLEARVRAAAQDLDRIVIRAGTLAGPVRGSQPVWDYQGGAVSPCAMSPIHQDTLEPILLEHARGCPRATLRFETEMESFAIVPGGVEATLRRRPDGRLTGVRARYLIAADGADSPVRGRLGIGMAGTDGFPRALMIRFRADLARWTGPRPAFLYQLPGGVLFRTHPDGRWACVAHAAAAAADPAALVRAAIGVDDVAVQVLGAQPWQPAALVADRFQAGPVFLAGDAAHRLLPSGAMGMNTAVHDVHNLAWKLAAVLQGWAGPGLLGTYEAERRPAAQRNVAWSLGNWRSLRQQHPPAASWPTRELIDLGAAYASAAVIPDRTPPPQPGPHYRPGARPGARAPHAWIATPAGRRSTIDLFDREFVLLAGPAGGALADAALTAAQARTVPLTAITVAEPAWASLYEVDPGGAVLVRPDGHVAWRTRTTPADPARAITDALTTITGR